MYIILLVSYVENDREWHARYKYYDTLKNVRKELTY